MERIPILRMGEFLLVTIQVDIHDQLALRLQDDLTHAIEKKGAKGVLIDISALEMVDSFIGRMISDISGMARILDAKTVLVGMQPAVAITLVELGLTLPGVATALNVERGMQLLRRSLHDSDGDDRFIKRLIASAQRARHRTQPPSSAPHGAATGFLSRRSNQDGHGGERIG